MKRKKTEERPPWETSNVGLMMFTSLMIILLAFFIMLSSMAVIDEQRQIEALGSVLGAFGLLPGGMSASERQTGALSPQSSPITEAESDMDLIQEMIKARLLAQKVRFLKGRDKRIISLESAMLFPPDQVELEPGMRPLLMEIAGVIKGGDYPVTIEGHTDDQPPMTEAFEDNWEISALRAVNVLRFLVEQGEVEPLRLSAYGYAGNQPAVANTSPRNRARNNRIDLVLDASESQAAEGYEADRDQPKTFDFRGFYFRLFGGDEEGS